MSPGHTSTALGAFYPGATAYHQLNRARELKSLRKHRESIAYSESCGDGSFCDGPSPLYPRP
jgi:hypothetical protein